MSNAKKVMPVVDVKLAGREFKLKFGMKALIKLDSEFGINVMEDGGASIANTPAMLAKIVWAGLQRYHRDLSLDDVEDLLDDSETSEIEKVIQDAFVSATEDESVKKTQKSEDQASKEKEA